MNRFLFAGFVFVFSAWLISCGGDKDKKKDSRQEVGEEVLLRFHPDPHAEYTMVYGFQSSIPAEGVTSNVDITIHLAVDSGNGSEYWLQTRYDRLAFKQSMVGVTDEFDTDKDSLGVDPVKDNMFAPVLAVMHKNVAMRINNRMEIIEEPNFDTLIPDALKSGVTLRDLNKSYEEFFVVWPAEKVHVGSEWEREIDLKDYTPIVLKAKYKVEKIDAEFVYLKVDADMTSKGENYGMEYVARASMSGKTRIRKKDGWLYESDLTLDINMESAGKSSKMSSHVTVRTK